MSSKFTEELCVMTMKNDTKSEEKLTCRFKTDMTRFICYLRDIAFVFFECHKNLKAKASLCLSIM